MHEDREVPIDALIAALDMLEALHGRDDGAPTQKVIDGFLRDLKVWGRETVVEAFGTIIYSAARQLQPGPDEPDATGLRMRIVAAAVARLDRGIHEVPTTQLPMVAGLLTAAFLDIGPYKWRTSFGSIEPDEHLAWCYAAWILVDFVDIATERPGGFAEAMRAVLSPES